MAKPFEPWLKYPPFLKERLSIIAGIIKTARENTVLLHDPDSGDNGWSLGCRAYVRICFAIRTAAEKFEWLTIVPDLDKALRFVFAIGGIPVRFFHGDAEDPPSRYLYAGQGEQGLLDLVFEMEGIEIRDGILRLAVETDETRQVSAVKLIEMDGDRSITGEYEIPFGAMDGAISMQPRGVSLPPASVGPLEEKKESADTTANAKRNAG